MKYVLHLFGLAHALAALLFAGAAVVLAIIATREGWHAMLGGLTVEGAQRMIEAVGLLAAAVVALQIAQTVTEEEVVREVHISAPTRVRRFVSRFFVVLIVALAIEGLVATFKAVHEELSDLLYAASLLFATAALLAAWGLFIRLNRYAEELEPEAMEEAKREDKKMQQ
jgi:hypothetical protein